MTREATGRPQIPRAEYGLVAAAGLAAAIAVGFMARRLWFRTDAWDFLAGRSLTLDAGDILLYAPPGGSTGSG